MKRSLSLVLALVMILGSFSSVFAAALPETATDKAAFLAKEGILKGNLEGELNLTQDLKRRDAIVLLSRLFDVEEEAKATSADELVFTDLTDAYYNGFIAWAVEEGYVVGKTDTTFGPNDPLTAQQFATMLLRALGYEENGEDLFAEAYAIAKGAGIFADVELEEKDTVTRGDMAAMTFNALGVVVKGSKETLAEKLGITLPKLAETDPKIVGIEARNYKEITIRVNDLDLFDNSKDELVSTENYRVLDGRGTNLAKRVQKVTLDEEANEIILVLDRAYTKDEIDRDNVRNDHSLVIRNMTGVNRVLNGTDYRFVIRDNEIPQLTKAQYLGKKGIKITATEPIRNTVPVRNFRVLDKNGVDKNIVMNLEVYDREIVLTPYGKEEFDLDLHEEIKVLWVEDYANMRSAEVVLEIEEPEADFEDAPVVVGVKAYDNKLEVKFDKEIYDDSVKAHESATKRGNVVYKIRGRVDAYAESVRMIDAYTAVYEFDRVLTDRYTTVDISGVKNHSEVEMVASNNHEIELILDRSEPIVVKEDVIFLANDEAQVVLSFDKNVTTIAKDHFVTTTNSDQTNGSVDRQYFSNYLKLRKYNETTKIYETVDLVEDGNNNLEDKVASVEVEGNVVTVTLRDMKSKDVYELETSRFEEVGRVDNRMFAQFTQITVPTATGGLYVVASETEEIYNTNTTARIGELRFTFDKQLDRVAVENERNYIFTNNAREIKFLDDLGGRVELDQNGRRINIIFPDGLTRNSFEKLEILKGIKGQEGSMLGATVEYAFENSADTARLIANGAEFVRGYDIYGRPTNHVVVTLDGGNVVIADPRTTETTTYVATGNAEKLTINAPRADVYVNGASATEQFDGEIVIENIKADTLHLGQHVADDVIVTVKTTKEFNIGNLNNPITSDIIIKADGVEAKVRVNGGEVTVIAKDKEVKAGSNGVVGANPKNSSVTDAVYNSTDGATIKFTVADAKGNAVKDETGALLGNSAVVKVNGKEVEFTINVVAGTEELDFIGKSNTVLELKDKVTVTVDGIAIGSFGARVTE